MYTIMKKSIHEVSKFSHELVFEFNNLDDFIKNSIGHFNIWYRLPDRHSVEGTGDELKLIKKVVKSLSCSRLYIEQPNGNLIPVYEPKGGFIL